MGIAFLADLARKRSLASAALLFLMLVDEIEGLVFVTVGVLLHRVDLFLDVQNVLFPAVVMIAAVASLVRNWRRAEKAALAPIEPLELAFLSQRIGASN